MNKNRSTEEITDNFEILSKKYLSLKSPQLKTSSIARYAFLLERYILPEFSELFIEDITRLDMERLSYKLLHEGGVEGAGLSVKTVSDTLQLVRSIMQYSCDVKGIPFNGVSVRIKQKCHPYPILSKKDQQKLLEYAQSEPSPKNIGILLGLFLGLRIGEVCAIRKNDISMTDSTVSIKKTVQRVPINCIAETQGLLSVSNMKEKMKKTVVIVTKPKSDKSVRIVPIPELLMCMIKDLPDWTGFLLSGSEHIIEPRNMENHLKKVLCKCKIEYINFHALRHTFATNCVELGFDIKTLSEILGHSSVSITLNRYVHTTIEQKRSNMNLINKLLEK